MGAANGQASGAVEQVSTREGYDRWASVYDGDGNPLIVLEEPLVRGRLGLVKGLTVLDVGCGTGRHTIPLAEAGALVTGIDFSEGMLGRAKQKSGAENVRWVSHDLATGWPFEDGAFDRVLCALVLDHVHDVTRFLGELGRVCKHRDRGGQIVLSVMHPAMMIQGVQARFTDPATGQRVMPESVPNQISDYVMGAVKAGLAIVHMSEHVVDRSLADRAPRAEKHLGWPLLLMMALERRGIDEHESYSSMG